MKRCSKCEKIKPLYEFHKLKKGGQGRHAMCRRCYSAYYKEPERAAQHKSRKRRYAYGVTPEQYDAMLERQNGVCAICRLAFGEKRSMWPAIDHDHKTGAIRGILHVRCNVGLGFFDDNPDTIDAAAAYLRGPDFQKEKSS